MKCETRRWVCSIDKNVRKLMAARKTRQPEGRKLLRVQLTGDEIGGELAHKRNELKPVPGTGADYHDLRQIGYGVDDEIIIGSYGVETHFLIGHFRAQ